MAKNPKPFLDWLFKNSGQKLTMRVKHEMVAKGDDVVLITTYTPVNDRKYGGSIDAHTENARAIFRKDVVTKQSKIVKPGNTDLSKLKVLNRER